MQNRLLGSGTSKETHDLAMVDSSVNDFKLFFLLYFLIDTIKQPVLPAQPLRLARDLQFGLVALSPPLPS